MLLVLIQTITPSTNALPVNKLLQNVAPLSDEVVSIL